MRAVLLGVGGSAGSPQIGGADGHGNWGQLDPSEPRNRRTRASIVLENDDFKRILVDTGPDLRLQLTSCGIPKVDAVLWTHAHADHIAGLDEIRILNRILGGPMPGYADQKTWAELKLRFDYALKPFAGGFFGRPVIEATLVEAGQALDIAGSLVRLIEQDHGTTTSLGLRIKNFAYCTDMVRLDETALAALAGIEILVVDCFSREAPHPTHANLPSVLELVARLRPGRTILTHMGPDMDYRALREMLPDGVEPGYDGMVLAF